MAWQVRELPHRHRVEPYATELRKPEVYTTKLSFELIDSPEDRQQYATLISSIRKLSFVSGGIAFMLWRTGPRSVTALGPRQA